MSTDSIEKTIFLRAPRSRVWQALTDSGEFGNWFGVRFEAPFESGAQIKGRITVPGYEDALMEIFIEQLVPESLFAYRWHPYAVDQAVDYSSEPTTLVEFRLADTAEGTSLTIVESGFDQLPPGRRSEAFRMNREGWTAQLTNIERYVTT
jgi:uncharacterized protein YndB with AHSA1/START domain